MHATRHTQKHANQTTQHKTEHFTLISSGRVQHDLVVVQQKTTFRLQACMSNSISAWPNTACNKSNSMYLNVQSKHLPLTSSRLVKCTMIWWFVQVQQTSSEAAHPPVTFLHTWYSHLITHKPIYLTPVPGLVSADYRTLPVISLNTWYIYHSKT